MATGATIEVDFFNTYIVRRTLATNYYDTDYSNDYFFSWAAIAPEVDIAQVFSPSGDANRNWYFEESRIRGGYNNVSTDQGVKAYLDEEFPLQQRRISTLIYSGVYNSRTGINQTNVFSVGDAITKSLDPVYGSIQKTYAEETNLIVFQEDRIHRALIDKDTIYTTESGTQTQAGRAVIGQFVQYKGEYGISKNPESFAIYNYRKYFADKNRNAIMRLSNDGLTEVSMYGMRDYFRDKLAEIDITNTYHSFVAEAGAGATLGDTLLIIDTDSIPTGQYITPGMEISTEQGGYVTLVNVTSNGTYVYYSKGFTTQYQTREDVIFRYATKGKIKGGWDIHNKNYVISMQKTPIRVTQDEESYKTLAFDEEINGWVSFFTYKPSQMFSLRNKYYTIGSSTSINSTQLYQQYFFVNPDPLTRGVFYGVRKPSSVTFVFNPQPDVVKNFNTISYEGSNGWEVESFVSGFTGQDPNPDGTATYVQNNDDILSIKSYDEGAYVDANTGYTLRAGFNRKENRYVANLRNNSAATAGEILFGAQMSGIKGYFATVKIETDETTQPGGPKELWSAGSNFVTSSF